MSGAARRLVERLQPAGWRIGIGVALLAMALAIYLLATLERQALTDTTNSYDNYWVSHQLQSEFQQLMVELARAAHGDPAAPAELVQLRPDVLVSRSRMAKEGVLAREFGHAPAYHEAIRVLDAGLTAADAAFDLRVALGLPEAARRIEAALAPAAAPVRELRHALRAFYAETNDAVQRRLSAYLTAIMALFALGAGGALAFIVLYAHQHRRLKRSEATFRATFDRAGVGIGHLAPSGRFLRVNATLCRLVGRSSEALRGADMATILPEAADFAAFIAPLTRERGPALALARDYRMANTLQGHAVFTFSLVTRRSGELDYVILVMEDITERRSIKAQLRQAQKMEAVGHLTGGVAHDFNNLLGVIVGNLDLLERQLIADEDARDRLARALAAAERGASLARRLLTLARRQTLNPEMVDVRRLVTEMIALLRPTIGESIQVRAELGAEPLFALVDQGQLEAALVNLTLNARDAMNGSGMLTIAAGRFAAGRERAIAELAEGDYVLISVGDTGSGMPAHVLERAFEPFFTTKDVGKGSGLGLSMVYGFVKQSGGHVHIESAEGRGTTILLYLPAVVARRTAVA
jgi:PAS domain S-box-containing protein